MLAPAASFNSALVRPSLIKCSLCRSLYPQTEGSMTASASRYVWLLLISSFLSAVAFAQEAWPTRPIQLIVPFPAGGGVDVIARPFAEILAELLHQSVIVVPRDGAAGT